MKKLIINISLISLLAAGCTKTINDEVPQNQIPADALANDVSSIRAALNGSYSAMLSANYMGLRYWLFADLYADNLTHVGTFPSFAQFAGKSILADNVEVSNMWQQIYIAINRANTAISAATANNSSTFTDKASVIAQARALRAYHYFNLLRFWGGNENGFNKGNDPNGKTWGVPVRLNPTLNEKDADPIARSGEAAVWNQILADLDPTTVIANLPTANNRIITQRAANALRSRVQLYREQWAEAEALATAVITPSPGLTNINFANGGLYTNLYGAVAPVSEVIWTLPFDPTNQNSIAFFYLPASLGGRNEVSASTGLRDAHEANDGRRIINFSSTTYPAGFPVSPAVNAKTLKYTRVSTGDDFYHHIRLAEVYLIRAEARARIGTDLAGAASDLNVVRTRAGLPNTTAATQADLLTAILAERRVELAHEGHRFFDLRRYDRKDLMGFTTNFYRVRLPIPQTELFRSGDILEKKPGY
jgi:starch-binding outer membrane protein, SusD/RagB family